MAEIPFITEVIEINERCIIQFMHLPKNYSLKSIELEGFKMQYLGRLKSFNRVKLISHWKKENKCLVNKFTEILNKRNWDFVKYPNPIGIVGIKI